MGGATPIPVYDLGRVPYRAALAFQRRGPLVPSGPGASGGGLAGP